MSKIVIGIHGMGNKPPRNLLQKWWRSALYEGLPKSFIHRYFRFRMVFWASVIHPVLLNPRSADREDPFYIKEPYSPGSPTGKSHGNGKLRKFLRDGLNHVVDGIADDNWFSDFILRHYIKDLNTYLNDGKARHDICTHLARELKKNKRKKILLIAHSMGTIVAWDVLTSYVPEIKIHTLVTIGSPLGLPLVKEKLLKNGNELRTPENITHAWYNLSDLNDIVAVSYDIKSDYLPNSKGICPEDRIIHNDYEIDGEKNHHKSYGYLRCREMGEILDDFLGIFPLVI